jgi:hypothetical protein
MIVSTPSRKERGYVSSFSRPIGQQPLYLRDAENWDLAFGRMSGGGAKQFEENT